jgi:hypothetical protein
MTLLDIFSSAQTVTTQSVCFQRRISALPSTVSVKPVVIPSIDRSGGCAALDRLKELDMDSRNNGGLDCRLDLSRKVRVMLRRNTDMGSGLVNGFMGTVIDFKTEMVMVLFDGKDDLLPIDRVRVKFEVMKNVYVHRQ